MSHVVVTGASRGIGAAIAREFARRGATVSVLARSADPLAALAAEIGGVAHPIDLLDAAQVDGVIAKIEAAAGPVDVLINNAAIASVGRLADVSATAITESFRLNVTSPIELCRQALPGMLELGYGRIVNISSLAGITAFPTLAVYGATKAALAHFTASMQRELRRTPVRMTIAQLGEVAGTDMMETARTSPTIAAVSKRLARSRALPTLTPEYVAAKIVDAADRGCRHVVVPGRVALFQLIRELPSRLNDAILIGVD